MPRRRHAVGRPLGGGLALSLLFCCGAVAVAAGLSDAGQHRAAEQVVLQTGTGAVRGAMFVNAGELGSRGGGKRRSLQRAAAPAGADTGAAAPSVNNQAQQVRQKIYYSSLASFWSTVFMPSAASGASSVAGGNAAAATPPASSSAAARPAAGTGANTGAASAATSGSGAVAVGSSARGRVAPSYVVLLAVVLLAVFIAMVLQYALRRVEAAVSGELSLQYRRAVHSLYQQVVAVTLLCGASVAVANSSWVASWSTGSEFGDLQGLLVDVTLFLAFTAFVFLCCALALVGCALAASKRWRAWEDESRYPDNIVWRFAMSLLKREGVMDTNLQWYQCGLKQLVDVDMEALGFLLLRTEFVPFVLRAPSVHYRNNRYWYFPRKRDCSALDFHFAHFDFERYLSHKSGHLLSKLLELPLSAWLILELLLVLICLPSFAPPAVQLAIFVVLGYVLLGVAAAVTNYQRNCYHERVHESRAWRALTGRILAKGPDTGELMWNKDHKKKEGQFKLISDLMAIMMRKSGDGHGYHAPGTGAGGGDDDDGGDCDGGGGRGCRSCLRKSRIIAAGAVAAQRRGAGSAVGNGGDNGAQPAADSGEVGEPACQHFPHFSLASTRVLLLLTAVYCSVLMAATGAFVLAGPPSTAATVATAVVAALVGMVPPPLVVLLLSRAMHYNVLLAATGRNRDDGLAAEVVADGKARMARSALRVLDAMVLRKFATAVEARRRGGGRGGSGRRSSHGRSRERRRQRGSSGSDQGSEACRSDSEAGGAGGSVFGSESDGVGGRSFFGDDDDDDDGGGRSDSSDVSSSDGGSSRAAEPWSLTFERLARYPAAEAVGLDELNALGAVYERRVRWPEFHAWYRRWMCRSDVAVAASRIYDTFFCENPAALTYAQVLRHRGDGGNPQEQALVAAPDALEAGAGAPAASRAAEWGSLSRRQFQHVFELRREVEHELRSSTDAVEQVILELFEVRTADSSGTVGPAAVTGHSFVPKDAFLAATLQALGAVAAVDPARGATKAEVALQDELAAFFDEADATMEGFVSVKTLAQVLHRYWFWPEPPGGAGATQ